MKVLEGTKPIMHTKCSKKQYFRGAWKGTSKRRSLLKPTGINNITPGTSKYSSNSNSKYSSNSAWKVAVLSSKALDLSTQSTSTFEQITWTCTCTCRCDPDMRTCTQFCSPKNEFCTNLVHPGCTQPYPGYTGTGTYFILQKWTQITQKPVLCLKAGTWYSKI